LYSREPTGRTLEKENPFIVCGQVYNSEIENVVHLFLQNSAIFPAHTHLNNNRRHSSVLTTNTNRLPGRIENIQFPIRLDNIFTVLII
jgi:hypothetical protein